MGLYNIDKTEKISFLSKEERKKKSLKNRKQYQ
jgi:hypothetical protein